MRLKVGREVVRYRYLRLIKGRYWYFRSKVTGNVRVPGTPDDGAFWRAYVDLLEKVERARGLAQQRKRERQVEARFLQKRRARDAHPKPFEK